jgi:cell fate regulator YaaT (PSP1 superfamily)
MQTVYWVRYGLMRRVARFDADRDAFQRGDTVVVRSTRGTELGEILAPVTAFGSAGGIGSRILRIAGTDDLDRAHRAELDRPRRFDACDRVFRDGVWPLELIDIEPLLDDRRTVLYYLGPHHLETEGLMNAFREACGLDVSFEPLGRDEPAEEEMHGCGTCGEGGCGSGGGCGSEDHGGCTGCAVKDLVRGRAGRVASGV